MGAVCPASDDAVYGVRIRVDKAQTLYTDEEYRAALARAGREQRPGGPLPVTARMARTVAAWWMAPHTELSRFVHTGHADGAELAAEVQILLSGPHAPAHGSAERDDLLTLLVWVAQLKYAADAAGRPAMTEDTAGRAGFTVGTRVQAHPATDAWMRGDRFGTVVTVGRKLVHVRMERSGRVLRFTPDLLTTATP